MKTGEVLLIIAAAGLVLYFATQQASAPIVPRVGSGVGQGSGSSTGRQGTNPSNNGTGGSGTPGDGQASTNGAAGTSPTTGAPAGTSGDYQGADTTTS